MGLVCYVSVEIRFCGADSHIIYHVGSKTIYEMENSAYSCLVERDDNEGLSAVREQQLKSITAKMDDKRFYIDKLQTFSKNKPDSTDSGCYSCIARHDDE